MQSSPFQIPLGCYLELDKLIIKLIWKHTQIRRAKKSLEKEDHGREVWPDIKTYYKIPVITTKWC